ncbi:CheB methylesterase domain-containing protein, partial [Luteimonas sp. Y-2-2-4F]
RVQPRGAPATPAPPAPRAFVPAAAGGARLIAIGASAGGTEAIRHVLEAMPAGAPPVLLTQHIPAAFSRPFVERLDRHSALHVVEAVDGAPVLPGHAYLPPPDRHLGIVRDGAGWRCAVVDGDPVNRHRPAVDVLFHAVARHAGARAVGAILTGMGDDGARGLLAMREAGAATLVQDDATSVVWGMPGAAVKLGAADEIVPLPQIAARLLDLARHEALA